MIRSLSLPILRSPPFPDVAEEIRAVSAWAAGSGSPSPRAPDWQARTRELLSMIRRLRVGGAFWERDRDPWRSDTQSDEARTLRALVDPALSDDGLAEAHDILIGTVDYRDPFTQTATTAERVVEILGFWRRQLEVNPAGHATGAGIAGWKQRQVRQLLWAGTDSDLSFARSASGALRQAQRRKGPLIVWPARTAANLPERAADAGVSLLRVEDGFIRSIGLGAACHPPFSIVLDSRGAHYDPRTPSDLECLLAETEFTPELVERALQLIALIIRSRISKYESGSGSEVLPKRTRRRILVTGQVEDDLSVLAGGDDVAGNLDLLRRAREAEPDAEIWFKPHPDVDAGHRKGRIADAEARRHADAIVRGVPMAALFDAVDGIHVLTSLAGFEALIRGLDVTTHGVPFYAGWGLTHDLGAVPSRRSRRLSLPELTAGVLLLYPRYLDPVTNLPCTAEVLIDRLSRQQQPQQTWLTRLRHLQGQLRRPFGI